MSPNFPMPKQKSISKLKKEADRVFSIFIRQRDTQCVTCGGRNDHAGHYISRSWLNLRYDPQNVNAQCVRCNIFLKGNMDEYTLFLVRTYGIEILDALKQRKRTTQFKRKDYEEIIQKYGQT